MTIIDWLIIGVVLLFAIIGYFKGLVATVLSLVGTLLAFFISFRFFKPLGDWLSSHFGWTTGPVHFIVFIISYLILFIGVQLIFKLINRALRIITELPIISLANRILGMAFGIIQGVLVAVVLLFVLSKFPLNSYLTTATDNSFLAPKLQVAVVLAKPFIPSAIQAVKSATTLFQ